MSDKMTPEIRFKGFSDDWEQRKLGDIANFSKGRGYTKNSLRKTGNEIILYGRLYTNFKTIISNVHTFADISNYAVFSTLGDVIVPGSGETAKDISRASVVNKDGIILGGDLNIIKINHNLLNAVFLALTISNGAQQKELIKKAQGKSIVHLHNSDLKKVKVVTPIVQEQEQIGTLFNKLDNTIALHQEKLLTLRSIKKGFLQILFPVITENMPQLRFSTFNEEWKQRKLAELATHRGGTAIEKYFTIDGKYKVISIGSYSLDSRYIDQNIRAISNDITDKRIVNKNELTMVLNDKTANGTIIGRTLLIKTNAEYVVNQRTEIIRPNKDFNAEFAYVTLNGIFRKKVKHIVQGGTQIYVNYPSVEKLIIDIPNLTEQIKISSFFDKISIIISLQQTKIDKLKKIKKAYLQKMFI